MKIKTLLTILSISTLGFISCVDEVEYGFGTSSDSISFSVTESTVWQDGTAASRSGVASPGIHAAGVYSLDRQDGQDKSLYLHSYVSEGFEKIAGDSVAGSRANTDAPYNNDNLFDHFAVSAFHYENQSGVSPKVLVVKDIVRPSTDNSKVWEFESSKRYWPNGGRVRFMSFYPARSGEGNIYPRENITDEVVIDHTTPEMSHAQCDLMYVVKEFSSPQQNSVKLDFKHAFTQVKFVMAKGMPEGRINYIKINNIRTKGAFHFPHGNSEYSDDIECYWEYDEEDDGKGTVKRNGDHYTPSGNDVTDISTNYKYVFMLLPQMLTADTEVEVSFTDKLTHPEFFASGNTTTTEQFEQHAIIFKGKIGVDAQGNAKEWKMGTTVTYKISNNSIDITPSLMVKKNNYVFSYIGGSDTLNITSTATISKSDGCSNTVEVPWIAEFIDENGNVITTADYGSWLNNFPLVAQGSVKNQIFNVPRPAKKDVEYRDIQPHTDWIRQQPKKTEIEDLSMREVAGKMTTANCYVINQAGTYKFPLVYGNGVKHGEINEAAYTYNGVPKGTGIDELRNYMKRFYNHLHNEIESPYIYENKDCTPASVELVWQDAKLIKSYKLVDNDTYIQFETHDPSIIGEGNAVLAVKDSNGTTMWSWHLWFTDYIPRQAPKVSETYDPLELNIRDKKIHYKYTDSGIDVAYEGEDILMGVPLGYCSDKIRHYYPRAVKLRITQKISDNVDGLTAEINISQYEGYIPLNANAPYYQFGRKDPLLPASGSFYAPEGIHNKSLETGTFKTAKGPVPLEEGIKNPFTMFLVDLTSNGTSRGWSSCHYNNLWSANISGRKDIVNLTKPDGGVQDVKTIYDPCPVGYEVPDLYVFTFATPDKNGQQSRLEQDWYKALNSPYSHIEYNKSDRNNHAALESFHDNNGMILYCQEMGGVGLWEKTLGVTFIPALGSRTYGGGTLTYLWKDDLRAYYWCSTPQFLTVDGIYQADNLASNFGIKDNVGKETQVMPVVQSTRATGNPIIPIVEKDYH